MNSSGDKSHAVRALPWELISAFLAIAKTGSLSGAARELGVAQPTVRRHVEALEETLNVVLFTRSHAGLALTEAAVAALPYAESMASTAEALLRSANATAHGDAGTVRVTASEIIGTEILPAIFATLRQKHPRIQIELSATNAKEDLLRRDADIAVRMVQPTQQALVAKKVGAVELGLFASESYLVGRKVPKNFTDLLRDHVLIGRDHDTTFYAALEAAGIRASARDFAFRTDNDVAALAAVRAGIGIGICQAPLALQTKSLVRVLSKVRFHLPIWIVTHENLRASKRVSIVFEHLAKSLEKYASERVLRKSK